MDKTPLVTSGNGKYKLHSWASISMQEMDSEKLTWLFLVLGGHDRTGGKNLGTIQGSEYFMEKVWMPSFIFQLTDGLESGKGML